MIDQLGRTTTVNSLESRDAKGREDRAFCLVGEDKLEGHRGGVPSGSEPACRALTCNAHAQQIPSLTEMKLQTHDANRCLLSALDILSL